MRFAAVALIAALAAVSVEAKTTHNVKPSEKQLEAMFTTFIKDHNKKYTHDEFFARFNTFKTNVEIIREHNISGVHNYTMAMNEFGDLTWAEFRATRLGFKHVDNSLLRAKNAKHIHSSKPIASSFDWRSSNVVTDVKNQGQCGSCWSFSATGSMEGAHAQATKTLVSLSEQQLVDCSTAQGNQGCQGGLMDQAFQYVITNKGITGEASYPYTATGPNTCNTAVSSVTTISSFSDVPAGDETQLLAYLQKNPVSIAIEADQSGFQFYASGVFDGTCGTALDHGVLLVGYGTDAGKDYWIVKNSWGATWGEQGYIRLIRGKNQCGLSNAASIPVV